MDYQKQNSEQFDDSWLREFLQQKEQEQLEKELEEAAQAQLAAEEAAQAELAAEEAAQAELAADEAAMEDAGLTSFEDAELDRIIQEVMADEEPQQELPEQIDQELGEDMLRQEVEQELNQQQEQEAAGNSWRQKIPVIKGRPKREKGSGLLGIPHILVTFVWLAIILAVGVYLGRVLWLCATDVLALGKEPQQITITITEQDDIGDVAQKLEKVGMIRYPWLFSRFAKMTDKADDIDPGTYTFNQKMGVEADYIGIAYDYNALIMAMQDYGEDKNVVKILFPEGYNCAQIFALLEEKGVCTVQELEEYAASGELNEYWFLEGVPRGHKYCLEGYLCPDTYEFYTDDQPKRILEKFLNEFDDRITDRLKEKFTEMNQTLAKNRADNGYSKEYIEENALTLHDVVVIASILEKERASNPEAFDFAAVIYNRLADPQDYPFLNCKSTLTYAIEYYNKGDLGSTSAQNASPFNTNTQPGLISKAICNPSLNSLAAALSPTKADYLYFIYDKDEGSHRFTASKSEYTAWKEELESKP